MATFCSPSIHPGSHSMPSPSDHAIMSFMPLMQLAMCLGYFFALRVGGHGLLYEGLGEVGQAGFRLGLRSRGVVIKAGALADAAVDVAHFQGKHRVAPAGPRVPPPPARRPCRPPRRPLPCPTRRAGRAVPARRRRTCTGRSWRRARWWCAARRCRRAWAWRAPAPRPSRRPPASFRRRFRRTRPAPLPWRRRLQRARLPRTFCD